MAEPEPQRRFPWGPVLTIAALAAVLCVVFRSGLVHDAPVSWPGTGAAVLAGAATFLAFRWLHNYFWGVVAALLLTLHPVFPHPTETAAEPVLAEALRLSALALLVCAWRFAFLGRFAGPAWLALLAALSATLAAAFLTESTAAFVVLLLAGPGLLAGGLLALLRRRRPGKHLPPAFSNIAAALLGAALVPSLCLLGLPPLLGLLQSSDGVGLAPASGDETSGDLLRSTFGDGTGFAPAGFSLADVEGWARPLPWLVLALMTWGVWRSLRRGYRQWSGQRPPVAWVLLLYAAICITGVFLHAEGSRAVSFLPLASLSVLLAVFCVADLVRGAAETLVLAPPAEADAPVE